MSRDRVKSCDRCAITSSVLYRVKWDESQQWIFVCDRCLLPIKTSNPLYVYGGTWKARKKR